LGDEGAAGGDGGEGSGGNCLRHDVSESSGFDGAGEDSHAGGVGGHLVEEVVLGAAADDVQCSEFFASPPRDFFEHFGDFGVGEGEGFEDDSGELAVGGGDGLVGFGAVGGDFSGHVSGGGEGGVFDIEDGGVGGGGFGELSEFGVIVFGAFAGPFAAAFLEEPETREVFEEPDFSPHAAFVGDVVGGGFFGEDGVVDFSAEEGPGAAGEVEPIVGSGGGGDGGDGGGGVVTADGDDGGFCGGEFFGDAGEDGSADGVGFAGDGDGGEEIRGDADGVEDGG